MAASSVGWSTVQGVLGADMQTVSYDRPGLGWSPRRPATESTSLLAITDRLRSLVMALALPRPFVLVAHSFGAYIATVYAHRFPQDIVGIVLVDPITPAEWMHPRAKEEWRRRRAVWLSHTARGVAAVGLIRLGLWGLLRRGHGNPGPVLGLSETLRRIAAEVGKLPSASARALRARWNEPSFFRTMAESIGALPQCAADASAQPIPAGMPVTILSSGDHSPDQIAEHAAIATQHVIVAGSTHFIHFGQPEVVCAAIRDLAAATWRR